MRVCMMDIKHILPIEVNYAIRHAKDRFQQTYVDYEPEALASEKRVFFLDAPAYGNIGDQAIALAMETFMADVLPDFKQIEVTEDMLLSSMKWLKSTIRKDDIICLTGGGNMGVMYQRYESVRRLVMKNFSDNPILIFPQTFDYGDTRYAIRELKRAEKEYGLVRNLVICARDEESYEKIKEHFHKSNVIFCPDIVLYLDYRKKFDKTEDVGICLRNDKERVLSEIQHKQIKEIYPQAIELTTMDETELPITWRNRKDVVERKLKEFGTKRLVLTDRLHGTIFAFITDTPCIAFPNTNGKVERVCSYLSQNGNVRFTKTVLGVTPEPENSNGTVMNRYGELLDAVRNMANS